MTSTGLIRLLCGKEDVRPTAFLSPTPSLHLSKAAILAGVPEVPAADMVEVSLGYGDTFILVDMLPPDFLALFRPSIFRAKLIVPFATLIVVSAHPFLVYSTDLGGNITVGHTGDTITTAGRNIAVLSAHHSGRAKQASDT